jgi:glycerol-3-phosphate cytidylyltransferase
MFVNNCMKILYTGGTFDLFHYGHVNFLRSCKRLADFVVVSLNTDEFVERYKGKRPLITYEGRKAVLMSCRFVDMVIPNEQGEDSKPSIENAKPDIIAVGDDWARKDYYKQMNFTQEWLDEKGITLVYIPYTKEISSTMIKSKCDKIACDLPSVLSSEGGENRV